MPIPRHSVPRHAGPSPANPQLAVAFRAEPNLTKLSASVNAQDALTAVDSPCFAMPHPADPILARPLRSQPFHARPSRA